MTVARLKEANGIKGRIALPPGFTLLVAGQEGGEAVDMEALPEQPRLPDLNHDRGGKTVTHTVRRGETLPTIAKRYGMSVAELKRSNGLKSDRLAAGAKLAVAAPAERKPAVERSKTETKSGKAANTQTASKKATTKVTRYTVKRGDTISSIARQFKVDQDDLLRWNRVTAKTLAAGQTLTIQLAQNPGADKR